MAMRAQMNIGLRHVLPIYPFLIMIAGTALHACRRLPRGPILAAALVAVITAESLLVYPHYLAFFNCAAGGPAKGHNWLVDSSLDWGQDLKGLKAWMTSADVDHVNLSYFGSADPAYYDIHHTALPGAPFHQADQVSRPRLPGYIAVSATNLRGIYLGEEGRKFFSPLLERQPVTTIGHTIFVYQIGE
jgi:hypothetical protein